MSEYQKLVTDHYKDQADRLGLDSSSTMPDQIVRKTEIDTFKKVLKILATHDSSILEIGCGNGVLLSELCDWGYRNAEGVDFVQEFVDLARSRRLPCKISQGDVKALKYSDDLFDIVLSERVIINLMDEDDQRKAFEEVHRVLKPGGCLICFEGFVAPLQNLNQARAEFDLSPIPMAKQNLWFSDEFFNSVISERFSILNIDGRNEFPPSGVLSNHYFMSRVYHAIMEKLVRDKEVGLRNSIFSNFFSKLASATDPIGDFSPVKFYILKKV